MTVCERSERRVGGRVVQGMKNVLDPCQDEVGRRRKWHGGFGREPRQSVANANGAGIPKPYSVTAVRFESWADISSVGAVRGTRWFFPGV